MQRRELLLLFVFLTACGSGGGARLSSTRAPREIDVPKLLLELGAERTTLLRRPDDTVESLEAHLRTVRGDERKATLRMLAVAHVYAAEKGGTEREIKADRRKARARANEASVGTKNKELAAEMAFVDLFATYRSGQKGAGRLAARYVERHLEPKELLFVAWIVRGEIALAEGKFDEALASYRFLLVHLDHPLYALALYRSAHAYRGANRANDARQALEEVRQLACAPDASKWTIDLGLVAARELGTALNEREDGSLRPSTCPPSVATRK